MAQDMETHIKQCDRCFMSKSRPQQTQITSNNSHQSHELVHMDFLTIESGKADKDVSILVVTNHFTRYTQAFKTPT